jgi:hypothetical protein
LSKQELVDRKNSTIPGHKKTPPLYSSTRLWSLVSLSSHEKKIWFSHLPNRNQTGFCYGKDVISQTPSLVKTHFIFH